MPTKTLQEIRRENMCLLIRGYRTQSQFAKSVGLAGAHVSQLVNGVRDMGEEVAMRIEKALGLTPGFMSLERGVPPPVPVIEPMLHVLPADEIKLLADYRRVPDFRKRVILDMVKGYLMVEQGVGAS